MIIKMKTTINLQDYDYFNQFSYKRQISDTTEFTPLQLARVLCYVGNNHNTEVKKWWLNFITVYINISTGEILHQLTHKTKNVGQEWVLTNETLVTKTDENFQPIPNPDFNPEDEESGTNTRYLQVSQYDKFSAMLFAILTPLMNASIDSDDALGSFETNGENW